MADPFVGEICCFGFNFAPRNWAQCNGQLMAISQNTALFSILGTTYGGDGRTTFALPNLQGRVPMHWGSSPTGLTTVIGEIMGEEDVTLLTTEMPLHNHIANAGRATVATQRTAKPTSNTYLSTSAVPNAVYSKAPQLNTSFAVNAIWTAGGSLPHENMQPYLTLNFCISLSGVFPSRN